MKKLLLGLALGVALMVGCSGTPAENRSYNGVVVNRIGTFGSSFKNDGTVHTFTYKGYEFICSHYPPQASTNFNKPNTVWLHGHCHNKNDNDEIHVKYNVFDVCWNGKVFSLDEIINNLKY